VAVNAALLLGHGFKGRHRDDSAGCHVLGVAVPRKSDLHFKAVERAINLCCGVAAEADRIVHLSRAFGCGDGKEVVKIAHACSCGLDTLKWQDAKKPRIAAGL